MLTFLMEIDNSSRHRSLLLEVLLICIINSSNSNSHHFYCRLHGKSSPSNAFSGIQSNTATHGKAE